MRVVWGVGAYTEHWTCCLIQSPVCSWTASLLWLTVGAPRCVVTSGLLPVFDLDAGFALLSSLTPRLLNSFPASLPLLCGIIRPLLGLCRRGQQHPCTVTGCYWNNVLHIYYIKNSAQQTGIVPLLAYTRITRYNKRSQHSSKSAGSYSPDISMCCFDKAAGLAHLHMTCGGTWCVGLWLCINVPVPNDMVRAMIRCQCTIY